MFETNLSIGVQINFYIESLIYYDYDMYNLRGHKYILSLY
jgi:hypothetical protein